MIIVHRIVNADPEVARSKGVPMPATTGGIKKGDDALPDILGSRIAQVTASLQDLMFGPPEVYIPIQ